MKTKRLVFCLLLSVMLSVTFIPTFAFATSADETDVQAEQEAEVQEPETQDEAVQDEIKGTDNNPDTVVAESAKEKADGDKGVVKTKGDTKDGDELLWKASALNDEVYLGEDGRVELEVEIDLSAYGEEETPELTYQWYSWDDEAEEEIEIDGETSLNYIATEPGSYFCNVREDLGDGNYNDKNVWFYVFSGDSGDDPLWTAEPYESSVNLSKNVTEIELEVVTDVSAYAGEEEPELSYQWFGSDEDGMMQEIAGETGTTYTATETGYYYCEVTDEDGHSTHVEFWVNYETAWKVESKEYEYKLSSTVDKVELEVIADFSACEEDEIPTLSYQWFGSDEDGMMQEIEGSTGATYTATETGEYYCYVTDEHGYSNQVWFQVGYETDWSIEGSQSGYYLSKTIAEVELEVIADFSAYGEGEEPALSYQWYGPDEDGATQKIDGATGTILTATREGNYYCEVTDEEGHSNQVDFWVNYKTDWSVEAYEDEPVLSKKVTEVELKVITDTTACEETPELSYQWYMVDTEEETGQAIEGETGTSYTATETGEYYCKVTDEDDNYNYVSFWVSYETDWTVEAFERTVFLANGEAEMKVVVDTEACEEQPELSYRWYRLAEEEIIIEGATGNTCIVTETGTYYCEVSDEEGHVNYIEFDVINDFADLEDVINYAEKLELNGEVEVDGTGIFSFTPTESGKYMFYSSSGEASNADPVGRVLDEDGQEIARNDDALSESGDFNVVFEAVAEKTYYLQAINYSGTATFTVGIAPSDLAGITFIPSAEPLIASRFCDDEYYELDNDYRVGDKFILNHADGTSTEYVCEVGGEENDSLFFVDELGEKLSGVVSLDYNWRYDSENEPGSTATVTATAEYAGLTSAEFTTSIKFVMSHYHLDKTAAVDPTCETEGNIEYWTCRECGKHFSDAEGESEITEADTVIPKSHNMTHHEAKAATCEAEGNIEYWTCETCGKFFKDAEGTIEVAEADTVIPKSHNMTHHEAKAATCEAEGNTAYWACGTCGRYFSDAEGKTEIEEGSWIISHPKTYTFANAVYNGKVQKPALTIKDANGNVIDPANYTVTYVNRANAGNGTATIEFNGDKYSGTIDKTFKINKAAQKMTVKAATKTLKVKKLKKKAQTVAAITVTKQGAAPKYKKLSGSAKLTVNYNTGKITVKKKTKKGTYKIKVRVTSGANANYNAAYRDVFVTVKVKK